VGAFFARLAVRFRIFTKPAFILTRPATVGYAPETKKKLSAPAD
jgi:hypothetical protein